MSTKYVFSIFFLFWVYTAVAQNAAFKSIHQQESEFYEQYNAQTEADWAAIRGTSKPNGRASSKACNLNKIVFGWHPYWSNGLEANYDWTLISDLSYFSYVVDPATGNATTTHSWATANVVSQALANGVRVNLCVTLFSDHATFFASSTSQQTLITNLINLVQSRGANGVNIDFEAVPSSQKTQFTAFLVDLCNQMHTAIPGSQVSIALYSVDWSSVFDIPVLNNYIDLFIIMGYDYYYSGSTTAGPTSGLYSLTSSYNYNTSKSVNTYLNAGVSPNKLVLGLPYFGFQWATSSNTVPSGATSTGTAKTYKTVRDNTSGFYTSANKHFNIDSYVPYFVYDDAGWYQCWADDDYSLGKKFELVYKRNIAGIGIWALGYDDGYPELWNKIKEKLTICRADACTDTIYDMGGPSWNYYNNENYYYTISPAGASSVSLNFSSFNLETGFDSLWIYDGNSIASPLIGGYTGTSIPATINSTGPSITIKFHSDNATNTAGYTAIWQCVIDNISPVTLINSPGMWKTADFTANFTDSDNINGTGIEKSFYNINDFNGTYWSANTNRGFYKDNFDTLQSQWTLVAGTWNVSGGNIFQSDEVLSNTNIYAPLNQTLSNRYLYQFRAKADGAGTNRRFGFHFFSDTAYLTNRGNSYFVWFRIDDQSLQFYKVINDTFYLKNTISGLITTPAQWYDYKISYDRITGAISVWRDNIFIGSWSDASPYYANGNYISFRTGNCSMTVDEINVFRSRYPSVNISVGDTTKDIRFQNPNPSTPSAKINSIVVDGNHNLSTVYSKNENVDWTPPSNILNVNDGLSYDIDTLFNNNIISASWDTSGDVNSGITGYLYAVGTNYGDSNTIGWTNNSLNTNFTLSGLSLTYGTTYYVSIKAKNSAGLFSQLTSSDGVIILSPNMLPIAQFTASDTVVCTGQNITLINNSVFADNYYWIFDGADITSSTLTNPIITYSNAGTYNITLIAININGSDTLIKSNYITVNQSPVADFSVNANSGYVPFPALFTNLSTFASSFLWNFGDGNTSTDVNPYNIYNFPGTYVVSLIASNLLCPPDTTTDTIFVSLNAINQNSTGKIQVYPSPANSKLIIDCTKVNYLIENIQILTIQGSTINTTNISTKNKTYLIDISALNDGIYILKINYKNSKSDYFVFFVVH